MKVKAAFAIALLVLAPRVFAASQSLEAQLIELSQKKDEAAITLLKVVKFISDEERSAIKAGNVQRIEGRELEADEVLDTLVRLKGRVPVLVAPPGIGKTAIAQRVVQKTLLKQYPDTPAFKEELSRMHWVQITPGRLLRIAKINNDIGRMKALEEFFESILEIEQKLDIKISTFMDEMHNLDSAQVEALLPFLESQSTSVRFFGATNADKLVLAFKNNGALLRRVKQIPVAEFDDETTLKLVDASWVPVIQEKYGVEFTADAKQRFIKFGTILNPDGGKFDAAIKLAQDLAIWNQRAENPKEVLNQEDVFAFFKAKTRFPVDPFNKSELHQYMAELEAKISAKLVGQSRMIKDTIEVFRDVILGTKKEMGVITLIGPSGTGKSELARMIAALGFNSPRAFIKIDANEYQNESDISKLFGAAPGLVTSHERSGIFPDFFDDPSQGKYGGVILIDEAEKANAQFWTRLMEFFEEGSFRGSDGKIRKARRHLVVLTSNRGDTILFPEAMKKLAKKHMTDYAAGIEEKDLKRLFQIKMSGKDEFQIPTPVLNRIDRFSVSTPLHTDDVNQIAENFTVGQVHELEDLFQVNVEVDAALLHRVAAGAFDPQYGARPIERALARLFSQVKDKMLADPKNFKNSDIAIKLREINEDTGEAAILVNGKERYVVELPRVVLDEPLLGSEVGETLARFNDIVPKMIIGQDDAVQRVKDVLVSFLSTPKEKRGTLGLMLLGLTGVGKTEMAKAVAAAVFGGANRAEVIPMGEINHESEFNNIVGSPPGYVGSEDVRAFERALMNHPEGGVIVFDEVTNLGGGDRGRKEALFKRLYNLFEEGKWTSAATSVTYDLRKYVFILTGNDGEKLFQGTSSDIIRLQTWKSNNKPAAVHKMLIERGVPEPFLGRMADTILMKPLLREETEQITAKLLEPVLTRFQSLGYEIRLPEHFNAEFGRRFFTQQKGARSLRSMAEVRMNAVISEAVVLKREELKDAKDKWIEIEIVDNLDTRPFIDDPEYRPKVEVRVRLGAGEKEMLTLERDVTQFAAIDKKLSLEQATATAYHEAGHAVLNDPDITGTELKYLTILGSEGNLGFALYGDDDLTQKIRPTDKKQMQVALARVLGGQVAMVMSGSEPDSGWGNDLEKARGLVQHYILKVALNKEFLGLTVDREGQPVLTEAQRDRASESMDKLMREGIKQATETLIKKWDLVESTVAVLLEKGSITESEFKQLRKDWDAEFNGKAPKAQPKFAECEKILLDN